MLEVSSLNVFRTENHVLHDLTLKVMPGECVAVIGSNGAGKSTLIETLMGFQKVSQGTILFQGKNISELAAHHRASRGIAWVPEGRRLFGDMTVIENIEMGLKSSKDRDEMKKIYPLFPVLESRLQQMAGTLSGGEQQMVALARALVSKPNLLLIDEMSIGLSPKYTHDVFHALDEIRKRGISVLLVEQNAVLALKHSERAYVIEQGKVVLEGESSQLLQSPQVKSAYLGL